MKQKAGSKITTCTQNAMPNQCVQNSPSLDPIHNK